MFDPNFDPLAELSSHGAEIVKIHAVLNHLIDANNNNCNEILKLREQNRRLASLVSLANKSVMDLNKEIDRLTPVQIPQKQSV
jgi:hypothetical protein